MHSAEAELKKEMLKFYPQNIKNNSQSHLPGQVRTKWTFITPNAPHIGGAWEKKRLRPVSKLAILEVETVE
jgi:hypothetical protein